MSRHRHEITATVTSVVLAGGSSSRLGGEDKTRLRIAGAPVLERVLRAAPTGRRVVVGPATDDGADLAGRHGAHFVREDPPGSGPLAALARGVGELTRADDGESGVDHIGTAGVQTVLVLGGDMPLLRPETLSALCADSAATGRVAALADGDDRTQYLCAAWPLARLLDALAAVENPEGGWADGSLRSLYAQLGEGELTTRAAIGAEATDVDTPESLAEAHRAAGPRIALAQITVSEEFETTALRVRRAVADAAAAGAHLVLLPEATLTPFGTDLRRAAEAHHDAFESLLQELADQHALVIAAGSFTTADADRVHNTVIVRGPAPGSHATAAATDDAGGAADDPIHLEYRKIHLFDAYGHRESDTVAPGHELVTIDLHGTRLGLATCYDVRFAEQFTALARRGAEAILLPLAWADGPGKSEQLRLLLQARALDSTSVVLAADQAPPADYAGRAARGIGQSAVIGPLGQIRQELGREEGMLVVDLDLAEIAAARAALPVLEHAADLPPA
ncbi:nitrilase-related carbon-nitrogen hydrolase [Brachybacterium sp. GCM10030267]|uniref:nitrilase-related carbon-nitrogen hydrolase n=1 Tax=Brachybacterium sp. GCM10030267 TaxID=3273381 RepID=UPI00361D536E